MLAIPVAGERARIEDRQCSRATAPEPRVEEAIRRFESQRPLFERCVADLADRKYMFGREPRAAIRV